MVKYQAYAEYKDSGVQWIGNIPKDWKFLRGKWKFKSLKEVNRDLQCMDRLALTMNGVIERSIDSDEGLQPAEFSGYQIFEKDDLVFKLIDLENFKTSRVGLVFKRGIMSPAYIRLKPFVGTDSKFFYYFYFDLYLRGVYNQIGGQGVRSALNATDLLEIEVCIPSLSEQKLIANFLDHETTKIDHLIEKQQQLIELLKEKRQAVISHAVTKGLDPNVPMKDSGVEWLGEVPEHWAIPQIGYHAEVTKLTGFEYTNLWAPNDDGEIIALRGFNIQERYLDLNKTERISQKLSYKLIRSKLYKNDLVLPCTGTLGNAALIDKDNTYHINQNIAKVTYDKKLFFPEFCLYWMTSLPFRQMIDFNNTSGMQPVLLIGDIRKLPIVLPPLSEQVEVVSYLNIKTQKFDSLIKKAESAISLMQERRTALISAAVTGKIDVRNWQAPNVAEADTEFSA
ncbi:hypothetical protein F991_00750 [Acinetobacter sp. CIP-A165]|uniref:restriction endonuclease subunit S n=1 Tax=Acinetobacter sp. CIP-A165 TaxID=40373 RepID=UPI0002D120FB|nr:restriction endonuclease subunit S [Acinetobacter sp. CIP-A165]ENU31382.1 hypothetical protein F991_00750 [Acinetobacter sp. CIP-A165]